VKRISDAEVGKRAEEARRMMASCALCPRDCRVDRTGGETGFCGLTASARCFREALYYHEESELVPSHMLFLSGCNLRCEFCLVSEWNEAPEEAPEMDLPKMRRRILDRLRAGARTLNFLGGEPSVSLCGLLDLIAPIRSKLRVVWNSNMYFSEEAARLLDGVVDVYLADFKCGNPTCAKKMLGVGDYLETVQRNLLFAERTADLIVRHLVLPGHSKCCREPVLRWLKENMPEVKLSLRGEYMPPSEPRKSPAEFLKEREFQAAFDRARALDLRMVQ
jgi:putative pyruvate formate lyase activating enzyme